MNKRRYCIDGKYYIIKGYVDYFNRVRLTVYEQQKSKIVLPLFKFKRLGKVIIPFIYDVEPFEEQIERKVVDFVKKYKKKQEITNFLDGR